MTATHQTEDDQLMIRIQDGDESAFEALVDRHWSSLIGFFVRNTRDRHLAEDLAQETMLRVHSQSWDYLPLGRFNGWMYRIARNLMIDDLRRRSRDALVKSRSGSQSGNEEDQGALSRLAGSVIQAEDRVSLTEFGEMVDELLQQIPDDQRQTFTLHHYVGLPLPEVAEIMETSVSTTKSRLRLAREKLGEKLKIRGLAPG